MERGAFEGSRVIPGNLPIPGSALFALILSKVLGGLGSCLQWLVVERTRPLSGDSFSHSAKEHRLPASVVLAPTVVNSTLRKRRQREASPL
jgi:hypothetical protein